MYTFVLSAPGSVFLYGGPAIRHKQICVAASLNLRTTLTFTLIPEGAVPMDFIELDFPNIMLNMHIPLRTFFIHFYNNSNHSFTGVRLHEAIKGFIHLISSKGYTGTYEPSNLAHRLSLEAFFYLLVLISYEKNIDIKSSFSVKVSTELPISKGLGSSASFSVCLAACFWRWSLLREGTSRNKFEDSDLKNIVDYANSCDNVIYHSSTLINIMISTYGSIQAFEGEVPADGMINSFPNLSSMKVLLVYSNINQKIIEQNVQMEMRRHSSTFINYILDSINAISTTSIQMLKEIDQKTCSLNNDNVENIGNHPSLINNYQILLNFIHMNQGLLKALGMSNPNMDIICSIARDFSLAGKIASKDAYAFILLPPNTTDEVIGCLLKNSNYIISEL